MAYPITNYTRVWVTGRIIDLAKAAREETNYGATGPVKFTPSPSVLLDSESGHVIDTRPFTVYPRVTDGFFKIQLPATDDPQINPTDWTYEVVEPTGRTYNIVVPYDTPTASISPDPEDLDGEQVIDLVDVVPDPDSNAGTVQLLVGRGIASVDYDGSNHLIVTYDDFTTHDAGTMGSHTHAESDVTSLVSDLAAKQPLDSDLTAIAGLSASNDDVVQRKSGAWANRTLAQLKTDLSLQPLDSDLTTIAGLTATTDSFLQAKSSAWAARTIAQVKTDLGIDQAPVALSDVSTPALDASLGRIFTLTATGDRTIAVPTNQVDGKVIEILHLASGGARTLALNSGTNGFAFGSDITALTATASGKIDVIQCQYTTLGSLNKWIVVGVVKGF
jgi:acid phosphatase family membrane protein YuiD